MVLTSRTNICYIYISALSCLKNVLAIVLGAVSRGSVHGRATFAAEGGYIERFIPNNSNSAGLTSITFHNL